MRFVIMKIIIGVTSEWSYGPGGLIKQGPLYYVSLTVYVYLTVYVSLSLSLSVYLLPISKY